MKNVQRNHSKASTTTENKKQGIQKSISYKKKLLGQTPICKIFPKHSA